MENEKRMEDLKMRNNKDGAAAALQPKKIAVINDIAGYGRCALTAAIPVISALKVQCCRTTQDIHPAFLTIIRIVWCLTLKSGRGWNFLLTGS